MRQPTDGPDRPVHFDGLSIAQLRHHPVDTDDARLAVLACHNGSMLEDPAHFEMMLE